MTQISSTEEQTVSAGDTLEVLAGGELVFSQVFGTLIVDPGGLAQSDNIDTGGDAFVFGSAAAIEVYGTMEVEAGGSLNEVFVEPGGIQAVDAPAGILTIDAGGSADFVVVDSGAVVNVLGTITSNIQVGSGGTITVSSGGSVIDGFSPLVAEGIYGTVDVLAGGSITHTRMVSGGVLDVAGSASNFFASNGGSAVISSGGIAQSITILSGGSIEVQSGGTAENFAISAGGTINALAGSEIDHFAISSGEFDIAGSASFFVVSNGGSAVVLSGGSAHNFTVASGGVAGVLGTVTSDAVVSAGGTLTISSGGLVTGASGSGTGISGTVSVQAGGIIDHVAVDSGGILNVAGTVDHDLLVDAGGTVNVSSGGLVTGASSSGTTVSGTVSVQAGGTIDHVTVDSGGILNVAGTVDHNLLVESGGTVNVSSGGLVTGATSSGTGIFGTVNVMAGGEADFVAVSSGGELAVGSAGSGAHLAVLSSGRVDLLGKLTSSIFVSGGGTVAVSSGGSASDVTVSSGGFLYVYAGGTASGAIIDSGGFEYVESGATDIGGTVSAGGEQFVEAGATTSGVTVDSGGFEFDQGGTDDGTKVSAGGKEVVSSGSTESGTIIFSGGTETVDGTDLGTDIRGGGSELVESGGFAGGLDVEGSGTVEFDAGATGSGANVVHAGGVVVFKGSATAGDGSYANSALGPLPSFDDATAAVYPDTNFLINNNIGGMLFQDSSTAATANITNLSGGATIFENASDAGGATIANDTGGVTAFYDSATAGSATITNDPASFVFFHGSSTAGGANITLEAAPHSGAVMGFGDNANAGSATITLNTATSAGSVLEFVGQSSAANSRITVNNDGTGTDGAVAQFHDSSTAANATIVNNSRFVSPLAATISASLQQAISDVRGGKPSEVAAQTAIDQIALALSASPDQPPVPVGALGFLDSSTPGSATITNDEVGATWFVNSGGAGGDHATITNSGEGTTDFWSTTAASASISNNDDGGTFFNKGSTAGQATVVNNGGFTWFNKGASAGGAQVTNNNGVVTFQDANAGSATITNNDGATVVLNISTGGSSLDPNSGAAAHIINAAGGLTVFLGAADPGRAVLQNTDPSAFVDFSFTSGLAGDGKISAGAISGGGTFYLGTDQLTLTGVGGNQTVSGTITSGGFASGGFTGGPGATLVQDGGNTLTLTGDIDAVNLVAEGGTLIISGTISGTSSASIGGSADSVVQRALLELVGSSAENVTFTSPVVLGGLKLDDPLDYSGQISGFKFRTGSIDLGSVAFVSGATAQVTSGNVLHVVDGGTTVDLHLDPADNFTGVKFSLFDDTHGGTQIVAGQVDTISLGHGFTLEDQDILILDGPVESTTVNSGGEQNVNSGGTSTDATVNSGGVDNVLPGGTDIGTVVNDGGTQTVLAGGTAIDTVLNDPGVQIVFSGGLAVSAALSGGEQDVYGTASSSLVASGGILIVESGGIANDPTIAGGTAEVMSGGTISGTVSFESAGGVLKIDGPNPDGALLPNATIAGFVPGDMIDLALIENVAGSHVDMNDATHLLTVSEGNDSFQLQFDPGQDFAGKFFHLASDNLGSGPGTLITEDTIACYCRGTLIATANGDVPVEMLQVGERVATASGVLRPIKWIGRRSYGGRFIMGRKDILPICIKAGALEENVPARELRVSPRHAMFTDGVLIEARDLVNGVSIVQVESVEKVEYFHVELESHDVIFAEGAWSETFVDDDSRGMFHNADEYALLYPDDTRVTAQYCAPRLDTGYAFEAVRRRIARRAGLVASTQEPGLLRGCIDSIDEKLITGWAQNENYPDAPVCLDIYSTGRLIGQTLAGRYRANFEEATIGNGCHAFVFAWPGGMTISPRAIEVRRSLDGAVLKSLVPQRRRAV